MKIELLILFITGVIIVNIYYDGKLLQKIYSYKKQYQMLIIAFIGLSLYLVFKKSPKQCADILLGANSYIKHVPIDSTTKSFLSPIIDFTGKTISQASINNYSNSTTAAPYINSNIYNMTHQQRKILSSSGKSTKRCVSETKKKYVAANQNWHCKHCNQQLSAWFEIDHVIKLEYGGSNNIENLEALCRECHGKKTALENL